jgi:hypothetical protein
MTEPQPQQQEQQEGWLGPVIGEQLLRETIGIAVMAGVLWYLGPGKLQIRAAVARARAWWDRADPHEPVIAGFRRDMSRWEHEQAANQDHTSGPGGCGCAG